MEMGITFMTGGLNIGVFFWDDLRKRNKRLTMIAGQYMLVWLVSVVVTC